MHSRCVQATKNAEKIIEEENTRRKQQKTKYTKSPEDYMSQKYSSVDSVLAVVDAEECLKECQRGTEVMKKVLEQNLQEFYTNIQLCYKDQEKAGGSRTQQREVNYQGVVGCLEANLLIL